MNNGGRKHIITALEHLKELLGKVFPKNPLTFGGIIVYWKLEISIGTVGTLLFGI
jgi:hypothetical protein